MQPKNFAAELTVPCFFFIADFLKRPNGTNRTNNFLRSLKHDDDDEVSE